MRDIFLLIKDRHSYYKIKKVFKIIRIRNPKTKKIYFKQIVKWVRTRMRKRLRSKRAVFYKKKTVWRWSDRPFLNKRPFWKWKSYKAVRIARRAIKSAGHSVISKPLTINKGWKVYDNEFYYYTKGKFLKKKTVNTINRFTWFLSRRRMRFFYKSKIYLNLHFARLFEYESRKRLYQVRKFFKKKRHKLGVFLHYFLNRLDVFLWHWRGEWGRWNLRKAQLMIYHGLILVNFQRKKTYLYKIKPSDCIIVSVGGQRAFGFYWKFYRSNFLKYGKTKYRPGYPIRHRGTERKVYLSRRSWAPLKPLMRSILTSHWNRLFFKYYCYFYELSRTVQAYVYILPTSFIALAKTQLITFVTKKRVYRFINYFVNMSYL